MQPHATRPRKRRSVTAICLMHRRWLLADARNRACDHTRRSMRRRPRRARHHQHRRRHGLARSAPPLRYFRPDPRNLSGGRYVADEVARLVIANHQTAGVRKLLRTVPVHKPNAQDFVRVHPSSDYRMNAPVIELKDEREEYVITKELLPELIGEFVNKTLFTAINRQGVTFLWPVRLPDPEGKQMEWWRSNREAAELAMKQWVRVKANMSLGAYEISVAESVISEPVWPDVTFQELIRLAFRDRLITTLDHPVIKRLRGLT